MWDNKMRLINKIRPGTSIFLAACLIFIIVLIFFTGCQSVPDKEGMPPVKYEPVTYPEPVVKLNTGDAIEIRFFYTPELNTIQTIRPDGRIDLQLIGEVLAQGKTPAELKEDLIERYSEKIKQIDIAIIVQTFSNRVVYVGGQVNAPGSIPMLGPLTALEALMLAGGVNLESGKYRDVLIIRHENGKWTGGKLDLEKVLNGVHTEPIYLRPLDIVYVPETRIYRIKRWLDQHIGTILPQVGFTYTINPDAGNSFGIDTTYTIGD